MDNKTPVDPKAVEEAVARIKEMSERLIEASRGAGLASLNAYEKSLESMLSFQRSAGKATQIDFISEFAAMQANYIKAMSEAYTSAARQLLS